MISTSDNPVGTAGSTANYHTKEFPAVPYSALDFHDTCELIDYNDPIAVRNCELVGMRDLDQVKCYKK